MPGRGDMQLRSLACTMILISAFVQKLECAWKD